MWRVIRWLCPGLDRSIRHMEGRLLELGDENDRLSKKVEHVLKRRAYPLTDSRINEVLSTATDAPLWAAVLDLVDRQAAAETDIALAANLSPEARTFNAGRAAGVRDFEAYLVQCQANAESSLRG